ncbi:MAG: hypothetical protein JWO56_2536 [Acidobacteria bacterium]|nr:hypothetical protein [Acidobacteriota bacterium]
MFVDQPVNLSVQLRDQAVFGGAVAMFAARPARPAARLFFAPLRPAAVLAADVAAPLVMLIEVDAVKVSVLVLAAVVCLCMTAGRTRAFALGIYGKAFGSSHDPAPLDDWRWRSAGNILKATLAAARAQTLAAAGSPIFT